MEPSSWSTSLHVAFAELDFVLHSSHSPIWKLNVYKISMRKRKFKERKRGRGKETLLESEQIGLLQHVMPDITDKSSISLSPSLKVTRRKRVRGECLICWRYWPRAVIQRWCLRTKILVKNTHSLRMPLRILAITYDIIDLLTFSPKYYLLTFH